MSSPSFRFDVFLSHSSADKPTVRKVAERLRDDGLRVWFDEWQIRLGDDILAKVEEGLEESAVLVQFISIHSLGSEWVGMEANTFRFRDPGNRLKRFIPVRLDQAPLPGTLKRLLYVTWVEDDAKVYAQLLEACRQSGEGGFMVAEAPSPEAAGLEGIHGEMLTSAVFNRTGDRILGIDGRGTLRSWDVASRRLVDDLGVSILGELTFEYARISFGDTDREIFFGGSDGEVGEARDGRQNTYYLGPADVTCIVATHFDGMMCAFLSDGGEAVWTWGGEQPSITVSSGATATVGCCLEDGRSLMIGTADGEICEYDVRKKRRRRMAPPTGAEVTCIAKDRFERLALTADAFGSCRVWNLTNHECVGTVEARGRVSAVCINSVRKWIGVASQGGELNVYDTVDGGCVGRFVFKSEILALHDRLDGDCFIAVTADGGVTNISLSSEAPILMSESDIALYSVQYTNAKVVLVGDSGSGKTGLSKRLASDTWEASDSTVGAWASHWKLHGENDTRTEREIWLWDFGGQADQRLIHQLYLSDTAVAVLVFDGQKENVFEALGQWDRDIHKSGGGCFAKLLVAGRIDAGGLRISRKQLNDFRVERGFINVLETSAKTGEGCDQLKNAIIEAIDWDRIPWRTSTEVFRTLKNEILRLKDEGTRLLRINELRDNLRLRLAERFATFNDDDIISVVGLMAGAGAIWRIGFHGWVLLQPEAINNYAQAVIRTMRNDPQERGCISEEKVLSADLDFTGIERLDADDERVVLHAMYQTLVARSLCLRETTDAGTQLIFPSYYRRERPDLSRHPAVQVSYRVSGFLDDIYASLVVRLHHAGAFKQDELWRFAADFRTPTGKKLGIKMTRLSEGDGEFDLYFATEIDAEIKIVFCQYVHEHLLSKGEEVTRLRLYICPHCGTPAENREVAMKKLQRWHSQGGWGISPSPSIICVDCEKRIPLWDDVEIYFASDALKQDVATLSRIANTSLDNESKERILVGEVISTVALAGQISRELTVSDHGIDMEIEFKSDVGQATGKKIYLQLKSGDSHLTKRASGVEVFRMTKERHAAYWREQAFPVMLVIRNSEGNIRWMEVRDRLRHAHEHGEDVQTLEFEGERFDAVSLMRVREAVLQNG